MKKHWLFILLALGGVLGYWLFTDPQGFANTVGTILGGLRTAAEQLIIFVRLLFGLTGG